MNEFGAELINVETTLAGRSPALSVSGDVQRLALRPESSFLYFAHRRFSFGPDPSLPLVVFPDGHARRVLVFPENKTLWFAPGACLEIDPDVAVIIRGPIRADVGMIFNLPEVRDLAVQPGLALVRIESEAVEEVLVEWFGVIASSDRNEGHLGQGVQNRRAIQACFDAACRDRSRSHFSTLGPEISPP